MTISIREQIEKDGFIIHGIQGISMYPLLIEGQDLVYIERINTPLQIKDMILFVRKDNENKYILHRIIDIKKDYFIVAGDNQIEKEIVFDDQIIGKVTSYFKNKKQIYLNDNEYLDYLGNLELDLKKRNILIPLNKNQKNFIMLIRKSLNSVSLDQSGFDYDAIYRIADKQKLVPFIYKALDKKYCSSESLSKFESDYYRNIQRNTLFNNEKEIIIEKLKSNNTKYIQLKGQLIDNLYPIPGTRYFSDVDILVDDDSLISSIMGDLGYIQIKNYDKVLEYKKDPIYCFEFHQKLFVLDGNLKEYFDGIFSRSNSINCNEYVMTNEDFIAYFLAHFKKHAQIGVGLRFYIDFYLIINKMQYDKNKLKNILIKLDLYDLYMSLTKEVKVLFEGNIDDIIDRNNIFSSGIYGDLGIKVENDIKALGKIGYLIKKIFPPKEYLFQYMPIAHKYKVLIPFAWIYRLIIKLFDKEEHKKVKLQFQKLIK